MNFLDKFLNQITMYRLVLYGLLVMVFYSLVLSVFGVLDFSPLELVVLLITLVGICFFANLAIARLFKAVVNAESSIITALILYFLLWPSTETNGIFLIIVAAISAIASKFFLTYKKKHIFNPASFGAFILFFFGSGALWWVGTLSMLPASLILGLLVVRKLRRFTMFLTFIFVTLTAFLLQVHLKGLNLFDETMQFFVSFPVFFFGTIMLTEPLTTPPTKKLQLMYASIVGLLFSWQGSFGPVILTTELVLIFGNIFSFLVSPKYKLYLNLIKKTKLSKDTYEFSFTKPPDFVFHPGQYLEWTLPLSRTDGRGNRRYFTLASSPTEPDLKLGVKFPEPKSYFKHKLLELKSEEKISAGQLMGDFTLPKSASKKLVFIAGGIGVTPFRSMLKFLIDNNEKRDIVFFYTNKSFSEIAYKDLFDEAEKKLGIRVVYVVTEEKMLPQDFKGETRRIDVDILKKYISDMDERTFYLSGPNAMVESHRKMLRKIGIGSSSIVTDFFPGY